MEEFKLRYKMYTYIAFDWVLGDIRPLIVLTSVRTSNITRMVNSSHVRTL